MALDEFERFLQIRNAQSSTGSSQYAGANAKRTAIRTSTAASTRNARKRTTTRQVLEDLPY